MSPERRTTLGWADYLVARDAQLTLTEMMARCLVDIRDNAVLTRESSEHVEGMLGAIDAYLAERDPDSYPGSARVREALDGQRKAQDKALREGAA